jgi:hypothetical protein
VAARPAAAPIDYSSAHLDRRLDAVRAAGGISLDGVLNEPAWETAPMAHNFIQNDPREGEPATYDTEVRVLYDDDAVYFGVFARDEEPGQLIVNDLKKDYATGGSDGFTVILDTFHDGRNGYQFATNPAGAKCETPDAGETFPPRISSRPIPPAPSGTRRCPMKAGKTTPTGMASGMWRRRSARPAGMPKSGFRSAR